MLRRGSATVRSVRATPGAFAPGVTAFTNIAEAGAERRCARGVLGHSLNALALQVLAGPRFQRWFILKFLIPALSLGLLSASLLPACAQDSPAPAQPFLHPLFSDNAVLQRDRRVPVWGWGTPGTEVVVKLGATTQSARCGLDGKWQAMVGPFPAGGPHELSVAGARAGEFARRTNILFGDVWLCSGQSNMQWGVGSSNNAAAEIAGANFPQIRLLTVPNVTSPTPRELANINWSVCSPQTVEGFSAVAYFFGREINQRTKVPIGLINSSWGGTIAEAWTSAQALNRDVPEFKPAIDALAPANTAVPFAQQMRDWWQKNDTGAAQNYQAADFGDATWKSMTLPGNWEASGDASLAQFDGVAWFRREIEVPASMAGRDVTLRLGDIDDRDTTFWNGEEVGATNQYGSQRAYKIPGDKIKAGRNVIAMRVLDTGGGGGLTGPADSMRLEVSATEFVPLAGGWKYLQGKSLNEMAPAPASLNNNPNVPTVLYNAMISPLVPFGIKGALWYQGESNADRAEQYQRLLPSLIRDWRGRFGSGDFPFYIVQLAGFMAPDEQPRNDDWPRLREAQNIAAQTVGKSDVALAIDIGEQNDIHPRNKQDVGLRLALQALAKDYGQKVVFEGPTLASATRRGSTMVLKMANTGGELSVKGDANRVFAIAGADKKFAWATPTMAGDTVTLSSPEVKEPVAVRFGWSNLPRAFVYNKAGLPAGPFRTDKW